MFLCSLFLIVSGGRHLYILLKSLEKIEPSTAKSTLICLLYELKTAIFDIYKKIVVRI